MGKSAMSICTYIYQPSVPIDVVGRQQSARGQLISFEIGSKTYDGKEGTRYQSVGPHCPATRRTLSGVI